MLLALYGPHAVGKTTFLDLNKDVFADVVPEGRELSVVLADLADEYRLDKEEDDWVVIHDKPRWKGKRAEKEDHMRAMIEDRKRLWIVESARYFGGMQDLIIDAHRRCFGGVKFIVFRCAADTARKFMIERCELRGKQYNNKYWTPQKLEYESSGRYVNAVINHYRPARVECFILPVSYDRSEWDMVKGKVKNLIRLKEDWWYGKNSAN